MSTEKAAAHVFFVRTRLQAIIAKQIRERHGLSKQNTICVFMYQFSKDEETEQIKQSFQYLRSNSALSATYISATSFLINLVKLVAILLYATVRYRTVNVYLASIDCYPIAVSLKIMPGITINTFDDGLANIGKSSKYYSVAPVAGQSIGRSLLRAVFPRGCAVWFRSKTRVHYTAYAGRTNIVGSDKIINIELRWDELLDKQDIALLPSRVNKVIVGVPHDDIQNLANSKEITIRLLPFVDIYIVHPREVFWHTSEKMVRLRSPAESVLFYLARKHNLVIYHFDSTIQLALENDSRFELVNLCTTKLSYDPARSDC